MPPIHPHNRSLETHPLGSNPRFHLFRGMAAALNARNVHAAGCIRHTTRRSSLLSGATPRFHFLSSEDSAQRSPAHSPYSALGTVLCSCRQRLRQDKTRSGAPPRGSGRGAALCAQRWLRGCALGCLGLAGGGLDGLGGGHQQEDEDCQYRDACHGAHHGSRGDPSIAALRFLRSGCREGAPSAGFGVVAGGWLLTARCRGRGWRQRRLAGPGPAACSRSPLR